MSCICDTGKSSHEAPHSVAGEGGAAQPKEYEALVGATRQAKKELWPELASNVESAEDLYYENMGKVSLKRLEHWEAAIARRERERCIQILRDKAWERSELRKPMTGAKAIEAAIRALGEGGEDE